MATILNIETSTDYCSVSISVDGKCKHLRVMQPDIEKKAAHSEFLAVFVKEILDEAGMKMSQLDAVALSGGPGSYTGLRIGTSTSKGLCFGADIPLISLNTLQIIAAMAKAKYAGQYDCIVPMIDARRMEVYTAVASPDLKLVTEVEAKIIDADSYAGYRGKKLVFCGNGAPKCSEILAKDGFVFMDDIYPSAEFMGELAEQAFKQKSFVDLVYYEPFYLKEFIATTSKKALF